MVFAEIPLGLHRRLTQAGASYFAAHGGQDEAGPDDAPYVVRLVCSFETTEAEVARFVELLGG